jgi:uncharacterized Fe-S cluster-containing radical SAM superfamily protein
VISAGLDPPRQRQSAQLLGSYGWFADHNSVQLQKRDNQRGEVVGKRLARCRLSVPGVKMSKHYAIRKSGADGWQGLAHIAEQEELGRRNTIGMGCNGALTDIDSAMREELAKMIVRPAVAETELQHFTVHAGNQIGGQCEASALRLEPTDKAVQPAHRNYAAIPEVSRNFFNSAAAVRS